MASVLVMAGSLALNLFAGAAVVVSNKSAFAAGFAFPTALTAIHYASNYLLLLLLQGLRSFEPRSPSSSSDQQTVRACTAVWALHNCVSNLSLRHNSVGMFQLMKILITPLICCFEFAFYGKRPTRARGACLLGSAIGVGLATITDISFTPAGAAIGLVSVCLSATLKVIQERLLQRDGWTSMQLMVTLRFELWSARDMSAISPHC
jgi:hypothetical protein